VKQPAKRALRAGSVPTGLRGDLHLHSTCTSCYRRHHRRRSRIPWEARQHNHRGRRVIPGTGRAPSSLSVARAWVNPPFTQEGLMKATVVTLKAVLEARGLDRYSGSRKADLVQRLLSAASV